jgi:hypothetical protein
MRTKLLALVAMFPAMAMTLGPTLARAQAEEDGIEVETADLPDEASQELARAAPERGDAPEVAVPESQRDRGDVEFDDFYAGLSSSGNWVQTPDYGWVWVPYRQTQVADWRPYLYGEWVWTQYGWTWVSDEDFGWATYHYGRWAYAPAYGWYWVPGYTWGPAWVVWRFGDAAVGWAPLYPGYVTWGPSYPFYWDHWVFIGPTYFYGYPVYHHWYHGHDVVVHHYHDTHWAHHWRSGGSRVYSGPRRSYVERTTSRPVRAARIETSSRPARASYVSSGNGGGRVTLYRPDARGAVRPSGPRPPANVSAKTGNGPDRKFVGSGLERPQSQAATLERGGRTTPSYRGTPAASQRGASPGNVRPQRTPDRSGSSGPTYRSPGNTPPRGAAPSPQVQQPQQQRRKPAPRVRTPSDGGASPRRPGAGLAPAPSGRSYADRSPVYRPPVGSSAGSFGASSGQGYRSPAPGASARTYADARPRAYGPSFGSSGPSGRSYSPPASSGGRNVSPARPSAPSRSGGSRPSARPSRH